MNTYIMKTFLKDLSSIKDLQTIRKILNNTIQALSFEKDKDDHKFKGIKNAWIRYVSKKKSHLRIIYIQKKDKIYLYRVGDHSIEDEVKTKYDLSKSSQIITLKRSMKGSSQGANQSIDFGFYLKNSSKTLLNKYMMSMYHFHHKHIFLISPFLTADLFSRQHHFGQFLDRSVEDDTYITLVTLPPKDKNELDFYDELESRSIFIYYKANLHSKLYIFDIDTTRLSPFQKGNRQSAFLGSANLTGPGFAFNNGKYNEELCYKIPDVSYSEAVSYAKWLTRQSTDHVTYKTKFTKSNRRQ